MKLRDMIGKGDTQGVIEAINLGANVNTKDEYGRTALIRVATGGDTESVKALIQAGANVNAKDDDGTTALMWAARSGNPETVNALIEAGADDLTDNEGKTALIHAAESKCSNPETVNALIEAGSYVKHKDNNGWTALDYASGNRKLRYTDALQRLRELSR